MKRRLIGAIALAAAAATLATACGSAGPTYTESDTAISVSVGETFSISLEANPGVGDDWRVVAPADGAVLGLLGSLFETDAPDDLVGAPGRTVFEFEAVGTGETVVEILNCYRCGTADAPTAENAGASETVRFTVSVS